MAVIPFAPRSVHALDGSVASERENGVAAKPSSYGDGRVP